ncbi:MAG: peptidoglycan DD-metalloendopeptidase family protein [Acidobacteria bacterium]|nr:peptidoglycan DD-metalloendopeptidase family protein [Acidobacteriota bacterium]
MAERSPEPLLSRRYTFIWVSHRTGKGRQVSVTARTLLYSLFALIFAIPVLMTFAVRSAARHEIAELRRTTQALEVENASHRAATAELTTQIESLQTLTSDLGTRVETTADITALDRLENLSRVQAAGGPGLLRASASSRLSSALRSPEDTFGVIRDLLGVLEARLRHFQGDVERREAMLASTPSIWPAYGWLSGGFGRRRDPFTGGVDFHQGLDISTDKGKPVYATADGLVETAAYSGAYGNLVAVNHGFGVVTRYGHLSRFAVRSGQPVRRGSVVGYVGSTGRATGTHLHYEVLLNGRFLNPLQLLTEPRR